MDILLVLTTGAFPFPISVETDRLMESFQQGTLAGRPALFFPNTDQAVVAVPCDQIVAIARVERRSVMPARPAIIQQTGMA